MNNKLSPFLKWLYLVLFLPSIAGAQLTSNAAPQSGSVASTTAPNQQAVSQTGLLPMFALDVEFDPNWVDGTDVPSKSAQYSHNGVNDAFQQVWDTLKPGGFDMIRFPVKLGDQQSPARLANLCVWAKANNVSLIPVLQITPTDLKTPSSLSGAASSFVATVVARLHQAGDAQFSTYTQIAYYQLEGTTNHLGRYPGLTPDAAQQALSSAADALRKSESQALQGTGVQATPILIAASLDFELIRQGAINGVPLDAGTEQKAQVSLNQFLTPFAAAQNIDAINVEWFPGSISSGDASHFAALLRTLKGALPGKQLTLTTGSSSAFNPATAQVQFYTLAVSNLGDFRASDGVNSSFLGVVFRQAFNGAQANANPPAGADPSTWDWNAKAQQLAAMWSQGTKSDDLAWWVSKVQDNMGLLTLQTNGAGGASVKPLPAESAFQQISSTVAQLSQNVISPSATSTAMPPAPSGAGMPQPGMPSYPGGTQATAQGYSAGNGMPQGGYSAYATGFQTPLQGYGISAGMPQTGNPPCAAGMQTLPPGYGAQTPQQGYGTVNGVINVMPQGVPANCLGGMAASAPNGSTAFQQMMFTILQQFSTQMTSAFVTKLSNSVTSGGYGGTNSAVGAAFQNASYGPNGAGTSSASAASSQSATAPYVSSPAAPQTPVSSSSTTNTVSLGPQDVTVDKSVTAIGQAVRVTAQVHNVSANQDLTGLTVSLVDPTGALTNLPMQAGIGVPHASTTPVSIPWTPTQASTSPYQLLVQIVDGSGNQIASATAPAITVNSAAASGGAGTSSTGVSGASSSTGSTGNSSSGVQSSSGTSASTPPVPPQINFFGIANASSAAPAGQIPTLLVQVSNPSQSAMQPAQAALSLDGTPTQTQNLGPLLPRQTRSALFNGVSAATGSHTAQVVVTTADGAVVSATTNVSGAAQGASSGATSSGTGSNPAGGLAGLPASGPTVRYGTPTTFQIGAFPQSVAAISPSTNPVNSSSAASSTNTGNAPSTNAVSATATTPEGSVGTRPGTVRSTLGSTGNSPGSSLPVRPGPPSVNTTATPGSTGGGVRNMTPGMPTPSSPANGNGLTRPGPGGMTGAFTSTIPRPGSPAQGVEAGIDLSVSMTDIRFTPATLRPGQAVSFSALIRNLGTVAVQGAQVSFRLMVDGRQAAISQPFAFNISGQGTFLANWSTLIPPGQQMQIIVAVTANGDLNPANNQAALTSNLGASGGSGRQ